MLAWVYECGHTPAPVTPPNDNDKLPDATAGKKQTKRLVLIGRARSGISWVDFDEIFKPLGGGGHMKAAAANIKFDPDPEVRRSLVRGGLWEGGGR